MATYSSFFSSGLLASPVTIYSRKSLNVGFDDEGMADASPRLGDFSPAAPSSPMAVADDGDIETKFNAFDRAATPTPEPRSWAHSSENMPLPNYELSSVESGMTGTYPGRSTSRSPSQLQNGRRLRRRRSSLASASSPMRAIKSPLINAGQALELQRHLHKSPLRARSSSVSLAAAATGMMAGGCDGFVPIESTFMTRLRSGSLSRRRHLRRASMMAPAPPPTAPLPELPPSLTDTPLCGFLSTPKTATPVLNRAPLSRKSVISPNIDDAAATMYRKGRDRSYSVNMHQRIEEMWED